MVVSAWYMDDSTEDQRLPHQQSPPAPVSKETLDALGVLQFHFDSATIDTNEAFNELLRTRGYTFTDVITISPEKLPNYEEKLKIFYKEHIHTDEEIRFCMEGSGYFDVRDHENRWVRVHVESGDLIILPAGSYHRFTLDSSNYMKAMRLFVGEPVWTPYNREDEGVEEMAARKGYETGFIAPLMTSTSAASSTTTA